MAIEILCVALFFMGTITGAILVRYGIGLGAKIVDGAKDGTLFDKSIPTEQEYTE